MTAALVMSNLLLVRIYELPLMLCWLRNPSIQTKSPALAAISSGSQGVDTKGVRGWGLGVREEEKLVQYGRNNLLVQEGRSKEAEGRRKESFYSKLLSLF